MDRRAKVRFRFTPKPLVGIPFGVVGIWMAISEVGFDAVKWYIPLGVAAGVLAWVVSVARWIRRGWMPETPTGERARSLRTFSTGFGVASAALVSALPARWEAAVMTVVASFVLGFIPCICFLPVLPTRGDRGS